MSTASTLIVAAIRPRNPGLLPWPVVEGAEDPPVAAVAACASGLGVPVWLGGGEPTLRRDLPALVDAVATATNAAVGLDTDGLPLAGAGVAAGLARLGVGRIRIGLHCGRPDAHDWLAGRSGAARRVRRAIEACRDAGLPVTARCLVTRPTTDWLEETVLLAARLGATAVELVRLRALGPAASQFITLSPRLGLAEPYLHAAVVAARDAGLAVRLLGLPRCSVPRVSSDLFGSESLRVPDVPGLQGLSEVLEGTPADPGCPSCPGVPVCGGAPADYVARFGRNEIDSERPGAPGVPRPQPPVPGVRPAPPPPRQGRAPATRLRFVVRQSSFPDLGGDPMAGEPVEAVRTVASQTFTGTSREIRKELARCAQEGVERLRIEGPGVFTHPDVASLLRDSLRLGIARVEACGDVRPLAQLSDREVVGLRGLARLESTTPEDGDPAEIDAVLARFSRLAGVEVQRRSPECHDSPAEDG